MTEGGQGVQPQAPGAALVAPGDELPPEEDLPEEEGPRPKLSALRVLTALVLLAIAGFGVFLWVRDTILNGNGEPTATTWFGAYVDATLTPVDQFQDTTVDPDRQVVVGFVVSAGASSCTPSWGSYYSLSGAAQRLQLDSRIAQLQQDGGRAIVSFGGKANSELALTCTSTSRLEAAYRSVVQRYHVTTVDFDIEGAALENWPSVQRRARAVAALQHSIRAAHGKLAVWLTLPSEPSGLNEAGLSVLHEMLHAGVGLAGVNTMAMDFGQPEPDMLQAVESDADAVHRQLTAAFSQYGYNLTSRQAWAHEGVTVMIGENDDPGETFSLGDAQGLASFASSMHLGRVSIWSLNRDAQCGSDFAELGVHSNTCTGVAQQALAFDRTFSSLLTGSAAGSPVTQKHTGHVTPANYPYPAWEPTVPYPHGYKVVWQDQIYEAKWYNQGDDPAQQVQYAYQSPWQLIGPVLPTDHAPTTTTLPPTTDPAWNPTSVYQAGVTVLFNGLPYRSKWYNQGDSPAQAANDPSGSPWEPLFTVPGEPTTG